MKLAILALVSVFALNACVVIPVKDKTQRHRCEISSDKKTLKVIDFAKETNTYYSISGILLTPIIVPASAIISGTYVLVNNTYHLGEQAIKCDDET